MAGCQIVDKKDRRKLAEFLAGEGEVLLPLLGLIETAEVGRNELIDVVGRAGIEALLQVAAGQIAGPKQPGRKRDGAVRWYGHQAGVVQLNERKVRVERPRLRKKGPGNAREVPLPAYASMQINGRVTQRVLQILMKGVSTRNYRHVLPAMADSVGISKSSVSREMIDGCQETLRELCERRFDTVPLVVIYIDGVRFGDWHVIVAVGVDESGCKHVLGLREGLDEMFTINRMNLSPTLRRCLGTTNIIESSFSGASAKTGRVKRWRNGAMVVRWAAAALLETEKHYKRIMGYRDLWQLQAHLNELDVQHRLASDRKAG